MNRTRLNGARLLVVLASAGLISAAPVKADIPEGVIQAVEAVQDPVNVAPPVVMPDAPQAAEKLIGEGEASYYGNELAGNRTASGERFNPQALTAAHRTLPLGSKIKVTNKRNGKSVVVRINDRGPFIKSRLIDVSYAAAQRIDMVRAGKASVKLALIG